MKTTRILKFGPEFFFVVIALTWVLFLVLAVRMRWAVFIRLRRPELLWQIDGFLALVGAAVNSFRWQRLDGAQRILFVVLGGAALAFVFSLAFD
jgi:hypothetical protein